MTSPSQISQRDIGSLLFQFQRATYQSRDVTADEMRGYQIIRQKSTKQTLINGIHIFRIANVRDIKYTRKHDATCRFSVLTSRRNVPLSSALSWHSSYDTCIQFQNERQPTRELENPRGNSYKSCKDTRCAQDDLRVAQYRNNVASQNIISYQSPIVVRPTNEQSRVNDNNTALSKHREPSARPHLPWRVFPSVSSSDQRARRRLLATFSLE